MNCQECRSLVERFLDGALTGFTKRKVNLHLSRCAGCRSYFDRRRQNQALAYRAMNDAIAGKRLPEDFAGRFLAEHIVPERRLFRFGRLWKVAAALAAMASFVGFAAFVAVERAKSGGYAEGGAEEARASAEVFGNALELVPDETVFDEPSVPSASVATSVSSVSQPKEGGQEIAARKQVAVALPAASAAALLSAAQASATADGGYTSASYVQDGLVAQWDGIDNAGTGTHDAGATVWKDLVGGCDMTLLGNGESWVNGKALSVNGPGAAGSTASPRYTTIEVVYRMTSTSGRCLFTSGLKWNGTNYYISRIVAFSGGTTAVFTDAHDNNPLGPTYYIPNANAGGYGIHSLSATYEDNNSDVVASAVMDGYLSASGKTTTTWHTATGVVMVGGRLVNSGDEGWYGEIYAIRLYGRALTADELAANLKVDKARFNMYSCITSGDPVAAAASNSCASAEAAPSAAIEARSRTLGWSEGISLWPTDWRFGTMLKIR